MPHPGPAHFGRGVIVSDGATPPSAWTGAPTVTIDDAALARPEDVVTELHECWSERRAVVVDLRVDPSLFRAPRPHPVEPYTLAPSFEPWHDRLHFLVWANNYDARQEGDPIWWWGRKAERLGATATPDAEADITLSDGTAAFVDGGPREPLDHGCVVVHSESVEAGRLTRVPAPTPPTAELAPDQLEAVSHGAGPARIIAPAGSGKTRVLTERLAHLLRDRAYERASVVAVAYNKKAQLELQDRCGELAPKVMTLNSLGYRLLADGSGQRPRVLDERDVRSILDDLVVVKRHRANVDPYAPYIEALTEVRLGLVDPSAVEASRDDVPGFADIFHPYRERLRQLGAVDFDDQIYAAIELLLYDGAFRRQAQNQHRHLLVDEFQDLTPAHVLLLRLLATPTLDVFAVGDDDQVIYGHAGASPSFLVDFADLFAGASSHQLEVNYRCPDEVVTQAASLLSYNHRRVDKVIRATETAATGQDRVQVIAHRPTEGADALRKVVTEYLEEGGDPSELAVLTRVNSLLLAPQVALADLDLPLDSTMGRDVLRRTGVRAALAYLRIGNNPNGAAGADIVEILKRPSRSLPPWFADRIRRRTTWPVRDLAKIADDVPEKVQSNVLRLASDLEHIVEVAAGGTTRDVLTAVRDRVGLGEAMGLLDGVRSATGSTHLDDLEALMQVADLNPDPVAFEQWLLEHLDTPPDRERGITLSTIHRVKGREWDRVVLFGVSDGLMPHRLTDDIEEERRVLHVGITRCRQRVAILADTTRRSSFLDELTGKASHAPPAAPAPRKRAAAAPPPVHVGSDLDGAELALFEGLKAWRSLRAKEDSVAPFIVAHNRMLEAVAKTQPTTLRELSTVNGIGPTKLELYGEELLEIVASAAG